MQLQDRYLVCRLLAPLTSIAFANIPQAFAPYWTRTLSYMTL